MKQLKILIIGRGGREAALAKKLMAEGHLVMVAPGNDGMMRTIPNIQETNFNGIVATAKSGLYDLVIIGPEAPLADGLADALRAEGVFVFGPDKAAAMLEADKWVGVDICRSANIRVPKTWKFQDAKSAKWCVKTLGPKNSVIKARWLCAGKGVFLPSTQAQADRAIDLLFSGAFGDSSLGILIQQRVKGVEISAFGLLCIKRYEEEGHSEWSTQVKLLGTAGDQKRRDEGGRGPNTGGMMSFCPSPHATPEIEERIVEEIFLRVASELLRRKIEYQGVLYAGLMLTPNGDIYVLEFNVRFGDPETQALLERVTSQNLGELFLAVAKGDNIMDLHVEFYEDRAICLVGADQGYPNDVQKGDVITGIKNAEKFATVLHAGTALERGQYKANGGRVLNFVARGSTWLKAAAAVEQAARTVQWKRKRYRKDLKALISRFPKQPKAA